jgi:hypothetical protein
MNDLNLFDLVPDHVTCDGCGQTWTTTAAWFTNGRAGCYQCFPLKEPTPLDVARKAAALGQKRAENAASDVWRNAARAWLQAYLLDHPTLFVDDIWALGCPEPKDRRAVGALIKSLASGPHPWIVKTGEYRPRTQGHGSPADVWKSLIYEGQRTA